MQRWLSWWGFPIASSTEGYDWEREPIAPLFSFSWKTFVLLLSFGQKMLSVSLLPCGLHWNDEHIAVPLRRKKSWRKCSRAGAPSRHCFDGTWRVVASDLEPAKTVVGYTICFNHPIYPKNPGTHQKRQRLSWPFKVKVPPPQQYRRPSSHWQRKWKRTGAQQWVCCPAPRCIAGDAGGGVESSTHGGKGYPVSRGSGTTRQLTQWKSLCVLVAFEAFHQGTGWYWHYDLHDQTHGIEILTNLTVQGSIGGAGRKAQRQARAKDARTLSKWPAKMTCKPFSSAPLVSHHPGIQVESRIPGCQQQ
jgi:hypothetical protein